jgi:hypothetical protein
VRQTSNSRMKSNRAPNSQPNINNVAMTQELMSKYIDEVINTTQIDQFKDKSDIII